jgi:DNA-binding response OmpR family regulator
LLDALRHRLGSRDDSGTAPPLHGRRILIVEGDLLLADEIETALRGLGAEIVRPAGSQADALDLIATSAITDAIVDINLGDGVKFDIADRLGDQRLRSLS